MPNEADDTVKAAVEDSKKKKNSKHDARLNENTRRADFVDARPLCPDELKSKTVFVESDVETKHAVALRTFVDEHRLNVVSRRVDADCFVVANPASLGNRIATVSALVGGYVASIGAFLRGRGVCFHHVPALRISRKLWASKQVKKKKGETQWNITKHLVKNHPRSRWELIKDSGDFTSMKAKAIARGHSSKVVGIVFGDDEKATNPSCMTFDEFILKNTKTLRRTSTSTSTSPSLIISNKQNHNNHHKIGRHTVAVCRMEPLSRAPV